MFPVSSSRGTPQSSGIWESRRENGSARVNQRENLASSISDEAGHRCVISASADRRTHGMLRRR